MTDNPQSIDTKGGKDNPGIQPAPASMTPTENSDAVNPQPAPQPAPQSPPQPAPVAPIAGNMVSREEMTAAVEKARQEEKAKLYETINDLKGKLSDKDVAIKAMQKGLEKDGISSEDFAKIVARETAKATSKKTEDLISTFEQRINALESENAILKSDKLRQRLIDENGGPESMIVDMITGSSESEILSQIAKAKRVRADILKEAGFSVNPQPNVPPNPAPNADVNVRTTLEGHALPQLPPSEVDPIPRSVDQLDLAKVQRYRPGQQTPQQRQERLQQAAAWASQNLKPEAVGQ